jgi:prepilin-type N-terminal cleavage/methylation domain-containing protein
MKRSMRSSKNAFTLIEVMLAAAIMLAGVVGAIQVLVSGSEMLETSRKQTAAMQIIDSELARVRLGDLSGTWYSASQPNAYPLGLPNGTTTISLPTRYSGTSYTDFRNLIQNFTCTRTVSYALSRTDFKQVVITVSWTNHEQRTYTRTGITYVGKNGLYASYQR